MGANRIEIRLWGPVNGRQIEHFIHDESLRSSYTKIKPEDTAVFSPNKLYTHIIVEDSSEQVAETVASKLRRKFDGV